MTRPRRPKPRPYYTQAEGERVRGQVLLRLLPEASARLTELADAQGVSRSALVEAWLLHGPGP